MAKRIQIYGVIAALIAGLVLLWSGLPGQLRAISTAETDDTQWTVFQLETEFANLSALLADNAGQVSLNSADIRLRTDIALSRVGLVSEGRGRALWSDNREAQTIIKSLADYADAAADIIDGPGDLSTDDVGRLRGLTEAIRPDVRRLAVLGVGLGSEAEEAERANFAAQLRRFGILAGVLITGLAGSLFYMDRLLDRARRNDDDLRASANRLSSTVTASLDGIVIANAAGQIIEFNESAVHIFGWMRDEILGRKMDDTIVPHDHRAAHAAGMARYQATRDPRVIDAGRIELSALRKSGEEFPVELNITSATQRGEEIYIAYIRDISERKINEQKLIDARDRAERADKAKSQFLTVMSHEMRTPLNGILGVLDLLKTTKLDKKQERFVQVAAASGEILLENVNEALDIARIEAGVMSLAPEVFSLRGTVRRVADVLRTLAEEKALSLEVEIDSSMNHDFLGDGGRINQILTNLIGNAIKFTEAGVITISLDGIHGPDETVARITVRDTGTGIPADQHEAIFEDFVALARSEGRQNRGDGLGLSISRKIARLMGGDLTVESREGEGSVFTLTVPLHRAAAQPNQADAPARHLSPEASKSILVVEDNAINRSVLREMLSGLGHQVTEAENGLEGMKFADSASFDLIIMDISMPFMDGIETTRRIRQGDGPNRDTYVLGLTAHGREEYRTKAKSAGMDEFCTKPLRLSKLKATLDGGDRGEHPAAPQLGVLALDVIGDLRSSLGDAKTRDTAARFFAELEDGAETLRRKSPSSEASAISERLHKLRGAAGLLGLPRVEAALDRASRASKSSDAEGFLSALDNVQTEAVSASKAVVALLSASEA